MTSLRVGTCVRTFFFRYVMSPFSLSLSFSLFANFLVEFSLFRFRTQTLNSKTQKGHSHEGHRFVFSCTRRLCTPPQGRRARRAKRIGTQPEALFHVDIINLSLSFFLSFPGASERKRERSTKTNDLSLISRAPFTRRYKDTTTEDINARATRTTTTTTKSQRSHPEEGRHLVSQWLANQRRKSSRSRSPQSSGSSSQTSCSSPRYRSSKNTAK